MDYSQGIAFGLCKTVSSEPKQAQWISDEDAYYRSATVVDFSKVRDAVGIWTVRLGSALSWVRNFVRRPRLADSSTS